MTWVSCGVSESDHEGYKRFIYKTSWIDRRSKWLEGDLYRIAHGSRWVPGLARLVAAGESQDLRVVDVYRGDPENQSKSQSMDSSTNNSTEDSTQDSTQESTQESTQVDDDFQRIKSHTILGSEGLPLSACTWVSHIIHTMHDAVVSKYLVL